MKRLITTAVVASCLGFLGGCATDSSQQSAAMDVDASLVTVQLELPGMT